MKLDVLVKIQVVKMHNVKTYIIAEAKESGIEVPRKHSKGAACFDMQAYIPEGDIEIHSKRYRIIRSGLCVIIPEGYEMQIRGRSSLWFKSHVTTGQLNTIDCDYRGEIAVKLFNHGFDNFCVKNGDRIAQLAIRVVPDIGFEECEGSIPVDTERGTGGFGHTGV